jgi:hypothetical protein
VNTATFLRKTPRFSRVNRKAEKIVKTPPFLRYILKLKFFQGFCPVFLLGHLSKKMNTVSSKRIRFAHEWTTSTNSQSCFIRLTTLKEKQYLLLN